MIQNVTIREQIKSAIKYAYEGAYDKRVADPVDFIDRQLEGVFPATAVAIEADDLRFLMEWARGGIERCPSIVYTDREQLNRIAAKYASEVE